MNEDEKRFLRKYNQLLLNEFLRIRKEHIAYPMHNAIKEYGETDICIVCDSLNASINRLNTHAKVLV